MWTWKKRFPFFFCWIYSKFFKDNICRSSSQDLLSAYYKLQVPLGNRETEGMILLRKSFDTKQYRQPMKQSEKQIFSQLFVVWLHMEPIIIGKNHMFMFIFIAVLKLKVKNGLTQARLVNIPNRSHQVVSHSTLNTRALHISYKLQTTAWKPSLHKT